jgi:asparagine synthase (glutamine-hydrolysing)
VWRDKEQFDEGSGTVEMLDEAIRSVTKNIDLEAYRAKYPMHTLRSVEECYYHQLLHQSFDKPQAILENVAHWTMGRLT